MLYFACLILMYGWKCLRNPSFNAPCTGHDSIHHRDIGNPQGVTVTITALFGHRASCAQGLFGVVCHVPGSDEPEEPTHYEVYILCLLEGTAEGRLFFFSLEPEVLRRRPFFIRPSLSCLSKPLCHNVSFTEVLSRVRR